MIKEIRYSGITKQPSDYEASDGELEVASGMVFETGLGGMRTPRMIQNIPEGYDLMFIHNTSLGRNFIYKDADGMMSWASETGGTELLTSLETDEEVDIYKVDAIGNTLVFLTEKGVRYFLFKNENGSNGYLSLGYHLPEVYCGFCLRGEPAVSIGNIDKISDFSYNQKLTDEQTKQITPQLSALVNKFIADSSVKKGKFIFPFFVRYALRLYDGSLTMHSAPILMVTATEAMPYVELRGSTGNEFSVRVISICHELFGMFIASNAPISPWKDIIQSLDIFVSAPMYSFNQDGDYNCIRLVNVGEEEHTPVGAEGWYDDYFTGTGDNFNIRPWKFFEYLKDTSLGALPNPYRYFELPEKSQEENIRDCSNFYLLKSIPFEEITGFRNPLYGGYKKIEVGDDYLQSLLMHESMSEDYDSHDTLIPQRSFVYNGRMNFTAIKKRLYKGFPATACLCNTAGEDGGNVTVSYAVVVRQNGEDFTCEVSDLENRRFAEGTLPYYFFFPNPNAIEVRITLYDEKKNERTYIQAKLRRHAFLNGAYFFRPFGTNEGVVSSFWGLLPSADRVPMVSMPNKVYTSEADNPFLFTSRGINTLNVGEIFGISAATRALSQGQFGQFPLYVFTSDGVWTFSTADDGSWKTITPVTRDVCLNADSITQIDTGVLFVAQRGVMLMSGAESRCISDTIRTLYPFDLEKLSGLKDYIDDESEWALLQQVAFPDFMQRCRMLYDYTHQLVVLYNAEYSYAYVYSMRPQRWTMMASKIEKTVSSYPWAYAIEGGCLVDYAADDGSAMMKQERQYVVTRPFKLGDADILKTIRTVVQRGVFDGGHMKSMLYGSRDLEHWQLVKSSSRCCIRGISGTPYKYFRMVLICTLQNGESLTGVTVEYRTKYTDKIR